MFNIFLDSPNFGSLFRAVRVLQSKTHKAKPVHILNAGFNDKKINASLYSLKSF
jgi:hypothetical protein